MKYPSTKRFHSFSFALVALLVLCMTFILFSVAAWADGVFIPNADFSDTSDYIGPNPPDWYIAGWISEGVTIVPRGGYTGVNAAKMSTSANQRYWYALNTTALTVEKNTSYTIEFYAKVSVNNGLRMSVFKNDYTNEANMLVPYKNLASSTYWRRYFIDFDSGDADTVYFRVQNSTQTAGDFFFCSFRIYGDGEEPSPEPVEGAPDFIVPGEDFPGGAAYRPIQIIDHSFEQTPTAWIMGNGFSVVAGDRDTAYGGNNYLTIPAGGAEVAKSARIPVISGRPMHHTLTFWAKGNFTIDVYDDNGDSKGSMEVIADNDAWYKQELHFMNYVSNKGIYIVIGAGGGAGGGSVDEFFMVQDEADDFYPNGDFESSSFSPATFTAAASFVGRADALSGEGALLISGAGGMELQLQPLAPNTGYYISFDMKPINGASIGVKNVGIGGFVSAEQSIAPSTGYARYDLTFKTGPDADSTSATFYITNDTAAGETYVDNVQMYAMPAVRKLVDDDFAVGAAFLPASDPDNERGWKYSNTFSDEFDLADGPANGLGAVLDHTKWTTSDPNRWVGEPNSARRFEFDGDNVSIKNGKLALSSFMYKNASDQDAWKTSLVMSQQQTLYGYYEIRARITPMSSSCAFWFRDNTSTSEIDAFELFGRATRPNAYGPGDIPITTLMWAGDYMANAYINSQRVYRSGLDLTEDYHIYGMELGEHFLRFYLDGELIQERENTHWHFPMNIMFDIEIFNSGQMGGYPTQEQYEQELYEADGTRRDPTDYMIDYCRVWRATVPQDDQPQWEEKYHIRKEAQAVYGSPDITGNTIDPIWDYAQEIGALHWNSGTDRGADAVAKTMWDEDYLYVMANVTKTHPVYVNPSNLGNSDMFQVFLDYQNKKAQTNDPANCFKFDLAANNNLGTVPVHPDLANIGHNVIVAEDNLGYIALFAIPWANGVIAAEDVIVGFDVQLQTGIAATGQRGGIMAWNDEDFKVWDGNIGMWYAGNLRLIAAPAPNNAVSIYGPETVVSGAGATATYTISASNMQQISAIDFEIEVDGDFLSSKEFSFENGFIRLSEANYGSELFWTNNGNIWTGKAILYNPASDGVDGDFDIFRMTFNVAEGSLGITNVKLNSVALSYKGDPVDVVIADGIATTEFTQWYSPYDLNKDGTIGLDDITFALQFLLIEKGDPGWEQAEACDVNGDDIIDIKDLILILANYTIPYYN